MKEVPEDLIDAFKEECHPALESVLCVDGVVQRVPEEDTESRSKRDQ